MNRNIEVGCLVMLVDSFEAATDGLGSVGTVEEKIFNQGKGIHIIQKGRVVESFDSEFIWRAKTSDGDIYAETGALMRIDNHDSSADEIEAERDNELEKTK